MKMRMRMLMWLFRIIYKEEKMNKKMIKINKIIRMKINNKKMMIIN